MSFYCTIITLNLPQFNSDLVKLVIESLIHIDEKHLRDVELDQVIRIADYFQMTDLVEVFSELMVADIKKENLQEMIHLIQDIQVPYLQKHCMDFLRADILDIFDPPFHCSIHALPRHLWMVP